MLLTVTSLVAGEPGVVAVVYVNVISSATDATVKLPLYPRLNVPAVLVLSVTFLMIIASPTFSLCGCSAITVTVLLDLVTLAMKHGFVSNS